jgi:hypothetical protein
MEAPVVYCSWGLFWSIILLVATTSRSEEIVERAPREAGGGGGGKQNSQTVQGAGITNTKYFRYFPKAAR